MADNPLQNVTYPSNGSEAHGYLTTPESGSGPGVIVIQEWWGLVDQIARTADRLAGEGFTALAPDLYGGRTTHDADEAPELMSSLKPDEAARDLAGAVEYLLAHEACTSSKVGAVGFCMGGGFVLQLAHQQGDKVGAAVAYYPVGGDTDDLSGVGCPVILQFGGDDDYTPADYIQGLEHKLRDAGANVTVHVHEGRGHAFFNEEDPFGTHDAELAQQTFDEMVEFFRENLN